MNCLRCRGLMISHSVEDGGVPTLSGSSSGWKCLLCGEVVDAVIAANRRERREPTRDRTRPRYLAWSGSSNRRGAKE